MRHQRLTVADIRAQKGKHQFTMVRTTDWQSLEAAEKAGVEMVSVTPEMMVDRRFREIAPTVFAVPGVNFFELGTADDFTRWAFKMLKHSADAVYVSAGLPTIRQLAADNVPVISHVGLIPSRNTWTGGFRAVGKTADGAIAVYRATKALEEAGAFGAEIEVVPAEVAAEICRRTSLFMVSMGAGTGGDCQYLFAEDMLGENTGHIPRHAKVYRDFAAEHKRLQAERVAAFSEFVSDVRSGAYPEAKHTVAVSEEELAKFRHELSLMGD
jgi:3-methyl-2-oxobutanoate hydroxymethyltransferase